MNNEIKPDIFILHYLYIFIRHLVIFRIALTETIFVVFQFIKLINLQTVESSVIFFKNVFVHK